MIENPKPSRGSYGAWMGDTKPPTVRARLEQLIDDALATAPKDFDSFLAAMKAAGTLPMHGKNPDGQGVQGWRFSERSGENTTRPLDRLDRQQTPEAA